MNTPAQAEIPFSAELARKALHLAGIVIPVAVVLLGRPTVLAILIPLTVLSFSADWFRHRSAPFNRFIARGFGFMMRPRELAPPGGRIAINGASWVLLSAALTFAIFPQAVAILAFSLLIVGDTAAAIIGRKFGRRRIGRSKKTYEGSAAFVVVGILLAAVVPELPFWIGLPGVLVAAVAEAAPRPLNDNIRIPLLSGAVMVLLIFLFQ